DYNLRGLIEPRCPECGNRSTWAELLDSELESHRWLFEHAKSRLARSFVNTFAFSQIPRRFWSEVRPAMIPPSRRLLGYWFILASLICTALLTHPFILTAEGYADIYKHRSDYRTQALSNPQLLSGITQRFGSIDACLEQIYPYPNFFAW